MCPGQGTEAMVTAAFCHAARPRPAGGLQLIDGRHYLVRVLVHSKKADVSVFSRTMVSHSCPMLISVCRAWHAYDPGNVLHSTLIWARSFIPVEAYSFAECTKYIKTNGSFT